VNGVEPLFLVDIGNSRVHLGLSDRGGLRRADLPHAQRENLESTIATLAAGERVERAAVSSVRDEATLAEVLAALARAGCTSAHVFRSAAELPLTMAVRTPQSVGLDRLMNVLGARSLASGAQVVLDLGTALTVSVLDAQDRFLGGAIAPGWRLMAQSLQRGTARLPLIEELPAVAAVGKDTGEAIASGLRHAVLGTARELIRATLAELGVPPATVWATGGDAARFAPALAEIARVDSDLTLKGLRFAFENLASQESKHGRRR
jgi:type III pantothenate kinase